jgi:predicted O-methyltransferase YrrM
MRINTLEGQKLNTYFQSLYPSEIDQLVLKARKLSEKFGKQSISMSHLEARILSTLIHAKGCHKFVEVGTLTGATAVWIAESLADNGELWTFEKDVQHAEAAQTIFEDYHQKSRTRIHLKIGDAGQMLTSIESEGPFDGIFIDGNKSAYGRYLDWAELNVKKGGLIIADNIFLGGSVFDQEIDSKFSAKQIEVMQKFNKRLANTDKYQSCIVPTSEGLMVAMKMF